MTCYECRHLVYVNTRDDSPHPKVYCSESKFDGILHYEYFVALDTCDEFKRKIQELAR